MKTFCTLHVIVLLILIQTIRGTVKWILDTNPIVYGHNVTLRCIVRDRTCPENYVRRWFGGPYKTLLGLNYKSSNLTKYNMYIIKNSESFVLIIYHFDESDMGCNYTCSCGFDQFTQILSISEIKFIYPVNRWITQTTIVSDKKHLFLNFSIEKVYPMPRCRVKLNDLVILPSMKFIEDYTDNWLLPKVTYSETLNRNQSLCDADLQVECWNDVSENFSFVIEKKLFNRGCDEPSLERIEILLSVTLSVTIVLIAFTVASFITFKTKFKKKQKYKSKTVVDQNKTYLFTNEEKVEENICLNILVDKSTEG